MGTSSSHSAPTSGGWPRLKTVVTRFAHQGGTDFGPVSPRDVVRAYVSALGGAAAAATKAEGGITAGTELARFLTTSNGLGLTQTLEQRGLGHLVGRSPLEVLQALADLIAGATATIEDAVARRAALDVLAERFKDAETYEDLEEALGPALSEDVLLATLKKFLARYVYLKMLNIIKEKIESKTMTAAEAKKIEDDLRAYIDANIAFEFSRIDVQNIDWNGPAAKELIERLISDAYEQLDQ